MFKIHSLAGIGRIRSRLVLTAVLVGVGLTCTVLSAKSEDENLPPWQKPPAKSRGYVPVKPASFDEIDPATPKESRSNDKKLPTLDESPIVESDESYPIEMGSGERRSHRYRTENDWESASCGGEECDDIGLGVRVFESRLRFRGEFLSMWSKSTEMPSLVTTNSGTPSRSEAGVLPNATTLFGGGNVDLGISTGVRFSLGFRTNSCDDSGLEAVYTVLGEKTKDFTALSTNYPVLARPFYDVQTSNQSSVIFAYPGQQTGNIHVGFDNQFQSLEMLWRKNLWTECDRQVDVLLGYRYGQFTENLMVDSTTLYTSAVGSIPTGTRIQVTDLFAAENDFHGAELGLSTKRQYDRFTLELLGKFALGNTRSRVKVTGNTTVSSANGSTTQNYGMLALPTNMGIYDSNNLTVIPELGITLGYHLTERMKVSCGYSFIYWSHLARPADQIDTNLNSAQFAGPTFAGNPAPQYKNMPGDYWTQGLTFGLDYQF